jgi:hypothetical protein
MIAESGLFKDKRLKIKKNTDKKHKNLNQSGLTPGI